MSVTRAGAVRDRSPTLAPQIRDAVVCREHRRELGVLEVRYRPLRHWRRLHRLRRLAERDEGRVLRCAVGEERAHSYGKNMAGCTRTVLEQDVYTTLYGFGAGLPVTDEDGRYTRRPASKPS